MNLYSNRYWKIPGYLTKRNKSFQQILNQVLTSIKLNDNDKIEDLRKIAILIYKIKLIETYLHLWTYYYLKAGIGQLTIQLSKQISTDQPRGTGLFVSNYWNDKNTSIKNILYEIQSNIRKTISSTTFVLNRSHL
jgi:hypothetical protein